MAAPWFGGGRLSAFFAVFAAVVAIVGVVVAIGFRQRDEVRQAGSASRAASAVVAAVIDGRDAVQDYLANRREAEIDRLAVDRLNSAATLAAERRASRGDASAINDVAVQARLVQQWNRIARAVIGRRQMSARQGVVVDDNYHQATKSGIIVISVALSWAATPRATGYIIQRTGGVGSLGGTCTGT